MDTFSIMIVISDEDYKNILEKNLKNSCHKIKTYKKFMTAIQELSNEQYDFLIIYIKDMQVTIENFVKAYPNTKLLIVTENPSYSEGSKFIKMGATDYFSIQNEIPQIVERIKKIKYLEKQKNEQKNIFIDKFFLKSKSHIFKKMIDQCEKVAKSKANILLIGESGTGKEVAAQYIHYNSSRYDKKFVPINCSSFTETLLESELFGYEEGSFTGAVKSKQGRVEISNGGTLFLDEVGDINLQTQTKLLRVLETKKIMRLGSNLERLIDFRLICATNKDLIKSIMDNKYREDFFYRISTIVIEVPSLRKRYEDLKDLIEFFMEESQKENGIIINNIEKEAEEFLYTYDYPGNIRELKNIIDRMVVLSQDGSITKEGIPIMFNIRKDSNLAVENKDPIIALRDYQKQSESKYIQRVLDSLGGNVSYAAKALQITPRHLFNKIKEYNLVKK